jgi:hypothetical protein
MKSIPFLLSTIASALCLALGLLYFAKASSNRSVKAEIVAQQTKNQETQDEIRKLDEESASQAKVLQISQGMLQNRQVQLQIQKELYNRAVNIKQRMDQIVLNTGYLAAKNNNQKLRDLLVKFDLKDAIFTPDQLSKVEEAIKNQQKNQGAAPAPVPSTPRTVLPGNTPTPR